MEPGINLVVMIGAGLIAGSLSGLIPFFVAKSRGRIKYALSSLIVCTLCGGAAGIVISLPLALILMGVAFALQKIPPALNENEIVNQ
ncbi:hypothetical protein JCM14469_43480 [Desulfatiferula olefinivorans]